MWIRIKWDRMGFNDRLLLLIAVNIFGFYKREGFLDQLSDYQLLKKDFIT
jgi:hypothetical protein